MENAVSELSSASAVVAGLLVVPEQEQIQAEGVSRAADAQHAAADQNEMAALDAGMLDVFSGHQDQLQSCWTKR